MSCISSQEHGYKNLRWKVRCDHCGCISSESMSCPRSARCEASMYSWMLALVHIGAPEGEPESYSNSPHGMDICDDCLRNWAIDYLVNH